MTEPRMPLEFESSKITTRRSYELLRINEVDEMLKRQFHEIDECVDMVEDQGLVPDGECHIQITVTQRMKVKESGNAS